jgi:hypothetical protein
MSIYNDYLSLYQEYAAAKSNVLPPRAFDTTTIKDVIEWKKQTAPSDQEKAALTQLQTELTQQLASNGAAFQTELLSLLEATHFPLENNDQVLGKIAALYESYASEIRLGLKEISTDEKFITENTRNYIFNFVSKLVTSNRMPMDSPEKFLSNDIMLKIFDAPPNKLLAAYQEMLETDKQKLLGCVSINDNHVITYNHKKLASYYNLLGEQQTRQYLSKFIAAAFKGDAQAENKIQASIDACIKEIVLINHPAAKAVEKPSPSKTSQPSTVRMLSNRLSTYLSKNPLEDKKSDSVNDKASKRKSMLPNMIAKRLSREETDLPVYEAETPSSKGKEVIADKIAVTSPKNTTSSPATTSTSTQTTASTPTATRTRSNMNTHRPPTAVEEQAYSGPKKPMR